MDVTDLDRSLEFYTKVLGLELAMRRDVDGALADGPTRPDLGAVS